VAERRGEPGEIVERAVEALRSQPPTDGDAVAQIVASAARARAEDSSPNDDDLFPAVAARRPSWLRVASFAAAVAGILLLGFGLWRSIQRQGTRDTVLTATGSGVGSASPVVRAASAPHESADAALVPTQFVFDGRARHVALVGDFNNWDDHATPLEREPGSSLWSVTVPIQRGRHIYAFLVDSTWTVDRRAPVARDPDFGVTGSVIIVGRP